MITSRPIIGQPGCYLLECSGCLWHAKFDISELPGVNPEQVRALAKREHACGRAKP